MRSVPSPKDAPAVVNGADSVPGGGPSSGLSLSGAIPAPIAPGDLLDVSEFHTPEFHSTVRVTSAGMASLPLVGDVAVLGMDEPQAAQSIAAALSEKGMLRHPQVRVLVMASVGQDVSILGEVMRPGVYPYGVHHRLLDLIAAASGTTPAAGTLAYVYHREDPATSHVVALDRSGAIADVRHNPELQPGDTVQMSRAGLVYVVGDVIRPGGFALEPGQPMTVLQAVSLAWGPSQNAALQKTLLIREQTGGSRTVTSLNLKRMLRGQDPDVPIGERDILFVPDSAVRNLWNRTMESVVQSTAGVSIYAGLVYSQRF
jgi:polysaccharide export outer membrane protein